MAARLLALVPRLAALTVMWLLATSTFTFAAGNNVGSQSPVARAGAAPTRPAVLVVPDVRGKAYVFAKGILQDAGFAWRVDGDVEGYAANSVSVQNPAPGTRVIDNGAPVVALRLDRNSDYGERGVPENMAPFRGSTAVLLSEWRRRAAAAAAAAAAAEREQEEAATTEPTTTATAPTTTEEAPTEPAPTEPAAPETRQPDFVVPGAPVEPADEIALPERARRLEARLAAAAKPSKRLVNFWLYQHSWIVSGALFGWQDGAEALRTLVRIDRKLEARWGFGARSEKVARRALARVERQAR